MQRPSLLKPSKSNYYAPEGRRTGNPALRPWAFTLSDNFQSSIAATGRKQSAFTTTTSTASRIRSRLSLLTPPAAHSSLLSPPPARSVASSVKTLHQGPYGKNPAPREKDRVRLKWETVVCPLLLPSLRYWVSLHRLRPYPAISRRLASILHAVLPRRLIYLS